MTAPRVSVIIPAYRAQATLPLVLSALEPHVLAAAHEVVVVDSGGSDDGPPADQRPTWVRSVSLSRRAFAGRARNLGASIARGQLLAFLDADAVPEPGWLDELERALTPRIELVAGAVLNGTPQSRWGTAEYMLEFLEWVPRRTARLEHAAGCNLLIRRAAFERSGGFPEDMRAGEDTVFSVGFAAGGTLAFAPQAQVSHLNRCEARDVLANQRRLGAAWVQVCVRVSLPGAALAAPYFAPVAVGGRLWAVVKQLRRYPIRPGRLIWHAPMLLAGLVAWGAGVAWPPRNRAPTVDSSEWTSSSA